MLETIIAFLTALIPALTTIFTTKSIKRQANRHSCRQEILTMILEDRVNMMNSQLPQNYQAIMDTFDEYKSQGGNSYCHQKVEEYQKLVDEFEAKKKGEK